jgi:hypothetical protein
MDDEAIERIVDRVRVSLKKRAASGESIRTINEIEAAALSLRDAVGEAVAEELGSESVRVEEKNSGENKAECRCGRFARFKGVRSHTAVTMIGVVLFRRRYFYCRHCDAGFCPADQRLGITRGAYTDRVQQQTSRLCTLAPYNVAVGILKDLCGVSVSISHAQRMVERADLFASSVLADRLQAANEADRVRLKIWSGDVPAPPKKAGAAQLYIEMDGVQTPLVRSWNEMKVGVCFSVSGKGIRSPKRYVSHLGSAHEFAPQLYALAIEAGLETARDVIVIGDGAQWIWNLADEQFPKSNQILDLWHVVDRLGKVARCAFGDNDTARVTQWLQERKEELLASQLHAVERALRRLAQGYPACKEAVRIEIGYHSNNADRMDYACFIDQGWHIGSGVAESACKRVVTQRLKGAGMHWVHTGAAAMAKLRCLALSLQWDELTKRWNASPAFRYAGAM